MKTSVFYIPLLALLLAACNKDAPLPGHSGPGRLALEVLDKNLQLPWGLAYLPGGDLLFSERGGRLNLLKKGAGTHSTLMTRQINTSGEGGLLSIAVDPDFDSNGFIYIYETTDSNRVVRLKLQNDVLTEDQVIVRGIPEAVNHDGGALKFGPDGYLYIGTGDVMQPSLAQNINSVAGKILRVDRNGNAAPGNPFNNKVWSYGHRNVQGFTWTGSGQMLATEHGPSGEFGWCCHDEVNRIQSGANYGWPQALAGTETGSLTAPLAHSGEDTWAPSGCTYLGKGAVWPNCLVVASLKGQRLIRFYLDGSGSQVLSMSDTLRDQFNRIRNIIEAPDGSLVFCTSNIGTPNAPLAGDDKIYRLYKK